jgi:hypothetical protein
MIVRRMRMAKSSQTLKTAIMLSKQTHEWKRYLPTMHNPRLVVAVVAAVDVVAWTPKAPELT